jgi:anti-anti-sigma factor
MLDTCEPENKVLIAFEGKMDTAKCMRIEADVRNTIAGAEGPIVFDLAKVGFVSSSFLRLCIFAHQKAGERGFEIINSGPMLKRVFKIAGLSAMLKGE